MRKVRSYLNEDVGGRRGILFRKVVWQLNSEIVMYVIVAESESGELRKYVNFSLKFDREVIFSGNLKDIRFGDRVVLSNRDVLHIVH